MTEDVFRKASATAPAGYFRWEAAGLRWLRVPGGARVADVVETAEDHLDLRRLHPVAPGRRAAEELGAALARTHGGGAPAYGSPPERWEGDGFLGPLAEPLPLRLTPATTWGQFFAEQRILPTLRIAVDRGLYDESERALFEAVARRLADGEHDDDAPPARIHGDLWSGNIVWTAEGAVLIDPAAHGGHRESDLAMLALFGCPHLDRVLGAYQEEHRLGAGWRERTRLHQLHPLMLHAALFGGGYTAQSVGHARRYA